MPEQGMIKVYELAKELGIDSISLLDKLRDLNINVKNHMSELRTEEVDLARNSLRKGAGAHEKAAKKPSTRVRKKSTDASAAPSSAEAPSKTASPVIRRRVKANDAEATTVYRSAAAQKTLSPIEDLSRESHLATEMAPSELEAEPEINEMSASSMAEEAIDEMAPTQSVSPSITKGTEASPQSMKEQRNKEPQQEISASTQTAIPQKPARAPVVLTPRPVAPRRSILKIVEATAPPPRPIIKPAPATSAIKPVTAKAGTTTTQPDKDGFRIIKMNKESLDQMAEEEAAKKRGGAREQEIRPEDVRFADYRKKELVFLPKKKKIPVGKEIKKTQITVSKAQKRVIQVQEAITVQELANQLSVKATDVIRKLMAMGQMATINQTLDFDTTSLLAQEYQYEVRNVAFQEQDILTQVEDTPEQLKSRPPIVTIMGHVDHGKTTLLDAIREANVAAGEAGGITQHIGAYTVEKNGKLITFIDTPGHEAFSVMRARGANVTDIVILVVAADDGPMPQTREAISHAQAAKVPIIVAVNKVDKPGANPEKIKQSLAELNLLAEDWGGDTQFVPVSALKKMNLDKLLDSILLQSEILDLKANPEGLAGGTVLEARLDKGRGPVVSVLVRRGTLKVGSPIVAGPYSGKVKAMVDHRGHQVEKAGPGFAVEVLGLENVPNAGESFYSTTTDAAAKEVADNRQTKLRANSSTPSAKLSLEELFSKIQSGVVKELNIILKADAYGSIEAIGDSLMKLSNEKVKVKVIHSAPGGISESDVLLASAANAVIIGFNVRPETKARQVSESEHVEIKCYNIIYELIDDVKKAMTGMLDKKKVEKFLGRAEVRQTFTVPKIGTIAGCSVIDGKLLRGANVRLLRDSRQIFEGKMSSLKRFKDDVKEVATGFECGIGIENYNDVKPGDIIEAFQIELVTPELNE